MTKLFWVLGGAAGYFIVFMIEQFSPLPKFIPWIASNGIIAVIVFIFLFKKIPSKHKILLPLVSVVLGFIISFVFANVALWQAEDLCRPLVDTQFQNGEENPLNNKGYAKSWIMTENCASKLMPFPWGKRPTI